MGDPQADMKYSDLFRISFVKLVLSWELLKEISFDQKLSYGSHSWNYIQAGGMQT